MGISIWQLLIVLLIVILLFGTKRLKTLGTDLGGAIKSFRQSVKDGDAQAAEEETKNAEQTQQPQQKIVQDDKGNVIDGEVTAKQQNSKV